MAGALKFLWMVPATGGGTITPSAVASGESANDFNLQWNFSPWPPTSAQPELAIGPGTQFNTQVNTGSPPTMDSCLANCYVRWQWHSCSDGSTVTPGAQLEVGTVFASLFQAHGGSVVYTASDLEVMFKV